MAQKSVFIRDATGLVRSVGTFDAFNISFSFVNILSSLWVYSWTPVGYPRANTALAILMIGPVVMLVAVIYAVMSNLIPRSGGDYVWVSRIVHPAIGFMQNFYMNFAFIYWLALVISWVPNWYLSVLFSWLGVATNNPTMATWAANMSAPMWTFIIGSLFIPYIFVILMGGMKTLALAQRVLFVIANFGMIALFVVMFTTPTSTFISNFNHYMQASGSTTTYNSVIYTAQTAGYSPGWGIIPTIIALPYAFSMYGGYNWSSYIAGEVKNAKTKMSRTILPTGLLSIICFTLMGFGIFHLAGFDFYNGIQYIYYNSPAAYPKALILPPLINYFVTFATNNFWIILAILVAYVFNGIWMIGALPAFISRCWFAWAFDRIVPTKLAEVSSRFKVPTYVVILEGLFTWIALYLLVFTQFFAYQANVIVGWMVCYAIVALSVAVLPWRKRDLFESVAPVYKRRFLGVPLLSILSGIMFAFFVFMTYAASVNSALGGPMTWASVGIGIFGMFIIGLAIYAASYLYHKRIGIDIGMAFKEIPPE